MTVLIKPDSSKPFLIAATWWSIIALGATTSAPLLPDSQQSLQEFLRSHHFRRIPYCRELRNAHDPCIRTCKRRRSQSNQRRIALSVELPSGSLHLLCKPHSLVDPYSRESRRVE